MPHYLGSTATSKLGRSFIKPFLRKLSLLGPWARALTREITLRWSNRGQDSATPPRISWLSLRQSGQCEHPTKRTVGWSSHASAISVDSTLNAQRWAHSNRWRLRAFVAPVFLLS